MSDSHSHDDAASHVKLYLVIGAALLVGTVVTVLAASAELGIILGITVAIIIATIKGSLVAGYFMHLKDERRLIYGVLALTAAFIVVMIGLFLFAYGDQQGVHHGPYLVPEGHVKVHHAEAQAEGEHVP
jgi:caa(3)-type oxidase subunit IV